MTINYIYGLVDPTDGKIRYIGKSINPRSRFEVHINESKRKSTYKECWINKLVSNGLKPYLIILDWCLDDSWRDLEKKYISELSDLTNLTQGGDGLVGYRHTDESRKKMSSSHKGEKNSFYGKSHTPETAKIISEKISKKIERDGNPMKGKNLSEESKRKISLKGKERAKIGALPKLPVLFGPDNYSSKKRIFISPNNEEYTVYNTKKFCETHNLSYHIVLKNINKGKINDPKDPKVKSRQRTKSLNTIGWTIIE